MSKRLSLVAMLLTGLAGQAPHQTFVPDLIQPSTLIVRLDLVGAMSSHVNPTSPIVAGSTLLLIDQAAGIYRWTQSEAIPLLQTSALPAGLKSIAGETILNAAANRAGTTVFVAFISATVPKGVTQQTSPRDQSDGWYVLYSFDFDGTVLSNGKPITALGARSDGHTGGGLVVLDDGSVLLAVGDNGDAYEDGGTASQDLSNHLAKILRIDPATGAVRVVARGVRNCQRLTLDRFADGIRVSFVDPGGWVSEELNSVRLDTLLAGPVLNFGWGRLEADLPSREGTLFIDRIGNSSGKAPPDPRFMDPVAEFGREAWPAAAVTGPVRSSLSLPDITWLFSELAHGGVYAVTGPPSTLRQPVYAVSLVDAEHRPIHLTDLVTGPRVDPRLFLFPDGTAGLLLESTGRFYRLTEQK